MAGRGGRGPRRSRTNRKTIAGPLKHRPSEPAGPAGHSACKSRFGARLGVAAFFARAGVLRPEAPAHAPDTQLGRLIARKATSHRLGQRLDPMDRQETPSPTLPLSGRVIGSLGGGEIRWGKILKLTTGGRDDGLFEAEPVGFVQAPLELRD